MTFSVRGDLARTLRDRTRGAMRRMVPSASCVLIAWFLLVALVNWTALFAPVAERLAGYAQSRGAALHYADIRFSPAGELVLDQVAVTAAGEHVSARSVAVGPAPWRAWLRGAPLAITFRGVKGRAPAAGAVLAPYAPSAPADKTAPSPAASPSAAHWTPPIAIAWRDATLDGLPGGPVTTNGLAIRRQGDVRLLAVSAARARARLTFSGDLGLRTPGSGRLQLSGLDLGVDLGFPARWRTDGTARISGRVTGTLTEPVLSGDAHIADGRIWGVPLIAAGASIHLTRDDFSFTKAGGMVQGAPESRLYGSGRFDLGGDGGLQVQISARQVPVADLAGALNLKGGVGGRALGELTLAGPYGKIHVNGGLSIADFELGRTVIRQVEGNVDWRPDETGGRLQLDDVRVAQADGSGGRLHFDGRIDETGPALGIVGEFAAADVKLGTVQIHSMQGPLRIGDGQIQLDAAIDGGEAKDVLGFKSGIASLFGGRLTGKLAVNGALADPKARLELGWGSVWGRTAGVHLDLRLDRDGFHVG